MRQLFLDKGDLVVKEVAQPLLDDYSVLVAVHYTYVSAGAKVNTINAQESFLSNVPHKVKQVLRTFAAQAVESAVIPTKADGTLDAKVYSLGYSCSGEVLSVGKKVTKFAPGDLVACADPRYAYHADLLCVRENYVVKVARKEFLKPASLTTIGAIALQGVRRANVQLGERVCVLGLGLMGHLTMQLAKLSGGVVYAADVIPARIELAKKMGAQAVFNAASDNLAKEINVLTEHHGADVTFICSASQSDALIEHAIAVTRRKGRIVIIGDVGLTINREQFYEKEVEIISCSAYSASSKRVYEEYNYQYPYEYVRWTPTRNMQAFLQLIENGSLNIAPFIEEEITLKQVEKAYQRIQNKLTFGMVLSYGRTEHIIPAKAIRAEHFLARNDQAVRFMPAVSDCVRVGFVGLSTGVQDRTLPAIRQLCNASLKAFYDVDTKVAMNVAKKYDGVKVYPTIDELFAHPSIDAVVIASAHPLHAQQTMDALHHGKAVFLERPLVTDFAQLNAMSAFLKKNPEVVLGVNFYRPFSPFMQKVKETVAVRSTPMMVHYRMNLPPTGRLYGNRAGRIISQVCQIVDLFCFLTDAPPISVSVEAIHASRDDIFPTDNVSAHIGFRDGSVCSLIFTSLGHSDLGSERMELFYDEKAIVMEEYMELYGFGLSSRFNQTMPTPDKGQDAFAAQFFNALHAQKFVPPISYDRLLTVAHLTLIIDQLACEGGGTKELA